MTIKYVSPNLSSSGWLETCPRKERYPLGSKYNVSLPHHLQVDVTETTDGRDYFVIMEGPHNGDRGNVTSAIDGKPTLIDGSHDTEGLVFVDFDRATIADGRIHGLLWLGSRPVQPPAPPTQESSAQQISSFINAQVAYATKLASTITVVTDATNLPPQDWSPLEIPDAPHDGGNHYLDASTYATVWFRVSYEGDKYLHCGRGTLGCVTVSPPGQWTTIYTYLIRRRRTKDRRSVGAIHIRLV